MLRRGDDLSTVRCAIPLYTRLRASCYETAPWIPSLPNQERGGAKFFAQSGIFWITPSAAGLVHLDYADYPRLARLCGIALVYNVLVLERIELRHFGSRARRRTTVNIVIEYNLFLSVS